MFGSKQFDFYVYVGVIVLIKFSALPILAPEVGSKSKMISSISDIRVFKSIWMSEVYLMSASGIIEKKLINGSHF